MKNISSSENLTLKRIKFLLSFLLSFLLELSSLLHLISVFRSGCNLSNSDVNRQYIKIFAGDLPVVVQGKMCCENRNRGKQAFQFSWVMRFKACLMVANICSAWSFEEG